MVQLDFLLVQVKPTNIKPALRLILCQADWIDEQSLPGIVKFFLGGQVDFP